MDRYSRQIRFAPFGEDGQQRLATATVAIAGCGALGTVHASILARAGAGVVRLIDRDYVELNNLQRQWLFEEADAAESMPKAIAAARHLRAANSTITIEPVVADLTAANAAELFEGVSLILDATDNFEARYLINDYAVSAGIPWIYGAAVGSYGIVMPVIPGETACLACVYPEPPAGAQPTCETAGVLGPVTSTVASIQAAAALQILSGHAEAVARKITTMDLWTGEIRQVREPGPDEQCRACGHRDFIWLDGRRRNPISLCGRNAVQIHERARPVDLGALARQLEPLGRVRHNEFALRFFLDAYEMTVFPDGRAIIKGTQDTAVARGLYARYIGA
ncbi:MAG: ThiF family adenylyltransferase [Bryobacteraceae bacterium]